MLLIRRRIQTAVGHGKYLRSAAGNCLHDSGDPAALMPSAHERSERRDKRLPTLPREVNPC